MLDLMYWLRIGLAFGLFWQAGLLFLILIQAQGLHWIEWLCLSFGLGIGLVGMEMLGLALVGLPFTLAVVVAPWGIGWAIDLARRRPVWRAPGWSLRLRYALT